MIEWYLQDREQKPEQNAPETRRGQRRLEPGPTDPHTRPGSSIGQSAWLLTRMLRVRVSPGAPPKKIREHAMTATVIHHSNCHDGGGGHPQAAGFTE